MADFIPNVYKNADKKIIEVIENARKETTENGGLRNWWRCGDCFCTQYNNGYYHIFVPEKCEIYGRILRDYRINKKGEMVYTSNYFSMPRMEDLINFCLERKIELKASGFSESAGKQVTGAIHHIYSNGIGIITNSGIAFIKSGNFKIL